MPMEEQKIKDITMWTQQGIEFAEENGKTLDDLVAYLTAAWGMKLVFDSMGKGITGKCCCEEEE